MFKISSFTFFVGKVRNTTSCWGSRGPESRQGAVMSLAGFETELGEEENLVGSCLVNN